MVAASSVNSFVCKMENSAARGLCAEPEIISKSRIRRPRWPRRNHRRRVRLRSRLVAGKVLGQANVIIVDREGLKALIVKMAALLGETIDPEGVGRLIESLTE